MSDISNVGTVTAADTLDPADGNMGSVAATTNDPAVPSAGSLQTAIIDPALDLGDHILGIEATFDPSDTVVELAVTGSQEAAQFGQSWHTSGNASPWTVRVDLTETGFDLAQPATFHAALTCQGATLASTDLTVP